MPFEGYFDPGDPRSPAFASEGATWPTCPAWRYLLASSDATGSWSFLRATGILFEFAQAVASHTHRWTGIQGMPACFSLCELDRQWLPIVSLVSWRLRIKTPCYWLPWQYVKITQPGPANVDIPLGPHYWPNGPPGSSGKELTLYQCIWDEEEPPFGWPP